MQVRCILIKIEKIPFPPKQNKFREEQAIQFRSVKQNRGIKTICWGKWNEIISERVVVSDTAKTKAVTNGLRDSAHVS